MNQQVKKQIDMHEGYLRENNMERIDDKLVKTIMDTKQGSRYILDTPIYDILANPRYRSMFEFNDKFMFQRKEESIRFSLMNKL